MRKKLLLITLLLVSALQAQNRILNALQHSNPNAAKSLLVFYKPDCPYCLRMDQAIAKDKAFTQSLKNNFNVVLLDINSAAGKTAAAQYKVKAVPTIIAVVNDTNEYQIQNGFSSTQKLASFLGMKPDQSKTTNSPDGTPPVCGNGDGCNATCQFEVNVCGDGTIQSGEQCDDGNTIDGDGCNGACQIEVVAVCGDGAIQAGEQCDDGNTTNGDGCSATCQIEVVAVCGDGAIQAGEQCDDGNTTNGDGCNATCLFENSPNDDCSDAITLAVGTSFESNQHTGYTYLATTTSAVQPSCQNDAHLDTWYRVTVPASGSLTIETRETTDTDYVFDTVLTVYSGSCSGTLTQVACNDDSVDLMSLVEVSGQTPGTTLYVAVWTYGTDPTNQGTYLVSAYNIPAPQNDDCANATVLTVGGTFDANAITTTSTAATTTSDVVPTCQTIANADTWYKLVVPASGSVTIETQVTSPEELYDSVLVVYSGNCGSLTQVDCSDDNGVGDNSLMSKVELTGQAPGSTLKVGVWKYGTLIANSGSFRLSAYDASLANNTFDSNSFTIYPNPVKDILNISSALSITSVQVYSILGQEVSAKAVNNNPNQIDMSSLSSGTYFVKVMSGGLMKTMKVIKE